MEYVIPVQATPSLAVDGVRGRFPVHRIYCVGRNYAEHAREMGHDPDREPPFFFMKPADAIVTDGRRLRLPVAQRRRAPRAGARRRAGLGRRPRCRPRGRWTSSTATRSGLDMTRRDLQGEAKKMGRPWDTGKAFDGSAPCSPIRRRVGDRPSRPKGAVWLEVNGAIAAARRPRPADLEDPRDDRVPLHALHAARPAT